MAQVVALPTTGKKKLIPELNGPGNLEVLFLFNLSIYKNLHSIMTESKNKHLNSAFKNKIKSQTLNPSFSCLPLIQRASPPPPINLF